MERENKATPNKKREETNIAYNEIILGDIEHLQILYARRLRKRMHSHCSCCWCNCAEWALLLIFMLSFMRRKKKCHILFFRPTQLLKLSRAQERITLEIRMWMAHLFGGFFVIFTCIFIFALPLNWSHIWKDSLENTHIIHDNLILDGFFRSFHISFSWSIECIHRIFRILLNCFRFRRLVERKTSNNFFVKTHAHEQKNQRKSKKKMSWKRTTRTRNVHCICVCNNNEIKINKYSTLFGSFFLSLEYDIVWDRREKKRSKWTNM